MIQDMTRGRPFGLLLRFALPLLVGNIFQLGTKYTKSMDMTYIGQDGKPHYPIMGCYGIGVGRLCASVCEAKHDDYGPIWPMSIAPWQVHICAIKANDPQGLVALRYLNTAALHGLRADNHAYRHAEQVGIREHVACADLAVIIQYLYTSCL